jgi:phenylacetate-CoA ligase
MGRFQDFLTQNALKKWAVERLSGTRRAMAQVYERESALVYQPARDVTRYQQEKLRQLAGAALAAPYWRHVFQQLGKCVSELTADDLPRLPFLTKDLLRNEAEDLMIPGARGVYENFSGGSTGIPIRFYQDARYKVHMGVSTRLCNEMAGAFPGARVAKLWGAPQDLRKITGPIGRAKLWALNQIYLDTFDMGADRMAAYHRQLTEFQPDLIQAYASSIHLLARYLRRNGIQPSYPRLGIISAAERLSPEMREDIESVFPARVFNRYGSREVSAIAAECDEHQGMHIHSPSYLVETIDPATGQIVHGRAGEIVITVLNNYAMPFIRYRIGDLGVLDDSPCACGRTSPRLREVIGRTSDNFVLSDGKIIHGEFFTHLFYGRAGVEQFQFEQEAREAFRLRVVPAKDWSQPMAQSIEHDIRQTIGAKPRFTIELCEEIPKTASGKFCFTKSMVDLDQELQAAQGPGARDLV